MRADERPSVLFVLPPGGVTPWFAEHLGTAFLRTVLAGAGISSAQYLPPRNPSLAGFARALRERRPAVVGFTAYESNLRACRAMARVVRETLPEAVVAVGGPNATFSPEETLALLGADLCLRGAGEGTIATIAEAVLGAGSPRGRLPDLLAGVANLVLATPDGPRHTRLGDISSFPREHFAHLDDLPSPYQAGVFETADVGILTARGCNQHCTYCSFAAISGRRVHFHSVERVLDDLAALKKLVERTDRRRRTIAFVDDAFTLAPRRAREICEGIVARGLQLPYDCETRADRVDPELLGLLRRAGFVSISFGLESAVPRVLRAIGKVQPPGAAGDPRLERERAYLDAFRRAVEAARDAGLEPSVSVIGGLPGERAGDLRATLAFVESLRVSLYVHNVLALMPGTPLYAERARHGLDAGREPETGAWRTRHAYDVEAVPPLPNALSRDHTWDEANDLSHALCGVPREDAADDASAWAVVVHEGRPDARIAAWLAGVLAVQGAVLLVGGRRATRAADHREWLRCLDAASVPWGQLALLSRGRTSREALELRSSGTLAEHRFVLGARWRPAPRAIVRRDGGACSVEVWLASRASAPPPARGVEPLLGGIPQIADGCRWWSAGRRCRRPRVLHAWPDGTVTPCWSRAAVLGRVGDPYPQLAAGGARLARDGACPLRPRGRGAHAAAAEGHEITAQLAWAVLPRTAHTTAAQPQEGSR